MARLQHRAELDLTRRGEGHGGLIMDIGACARRAEMNVPPLQRAQLTVPPWGGPSLSRGVPSSSA